MGVENMLVAFSTKEKEASGVDITPQWQEACKQAVMESKQGKIYRYLRRSSVKNARSGTVIF